MKKMFFSCGLIGCLLFLTYCKDKKTDFKSTPPKTTKTILTITHGPYLQAVNEVQAVMVWTTDYDAVSTVEIAPDNNIDFAKASTKYYQWQNEKDRKVSKVHSILVTSLKKGVTYRYKISSRLVKKKKVPTATLR